MLTYDGQWVELLLETRKYHFWWGKWGHVDSSMGRMIKLSYHHHLVEPTGSLVQLQMSRAATRPWVTDKTQIGSEWREDGSRACFLWTRCRVSTLDQLLVLSLSLDQLLGSFQVDYSLQQRCMSKFRIFWISSLSGSIDQWSWNLKKFMAFPTRTLVCSFEFRSFIVGTNHTTNESEFFKGRAVKYEPLASIWWSIFWWSSRLQSELSSRSFSPKYTNYSPCIAPITDFAPPTKPHSIIRSKSLWASFDDIYNNSSPF